MRIGRVAGILALAAVAAHADQTFTDATFLNADWTITVLTDGNGGATNAAQSPVGGNPGPFRAVTITVNGFGGMGESVVLGLHFNRNAIYDLSRGPITSLDYSEDSIPIGNSASGDGQLTGPALLQNGRLFLCERLETSVAMGWTRSSLTGLLASDFTEVAVVNGAIVQTNARPDFSGFGGVIQFGFFRAAQDRINVTSIFGIDNWTVVLRTGAPATLTITTLSPLPVAQPNLFYSQPLATTGGTAPYTYALTAGTLPPGVTLAAGLLSGTPTTPGIFVFTITATDSRQLRGSKVFQLAVAMAGRSLVVQTPSLSFTAPAGGDPASPQSVVVLSTSGNSIPLAVSVDDGAVGPAPVWLTARPRLPATPARIVAIADPGNLAAGTYNARIRLVVANETPLDIPVRLTITSNPPQLQAFPTALRFGGRFSGPATQDQTIVIRNGGGGGPINFTVSIANTSPWLQLSATSGVAAPGRPGLLRVGVDSKNLAAGVYRDTLRISSSAGNAQALVTLIVTPDGPVLRLPVTGLLIPVQQGRTQVSRTVRVLNIGTPGSTVNFTAEVTQSTNFLAVSPANGTAALVNPATLTLTVLPAADALAPGAYYALVRVTDRNAMNSPQFLSVVLSVADAASASSLDVSVSGLNFVAGVGATSKPFQVTTTSPDSNPFQVAANTDDGANWLAASPAAGQVSATSPATITVTVNPAGLRAGVYTGEVDIALGTLLRAVNVTLVVPPAGLGAASVAGGSAGERPAGNRNAGCTPSHVVVNPNALALNFSVPAAWPSTISVQLSDDCGNPIGGNSGSVVARFDNGDLPLTLADPGQDSTYSADWTPQFPASPAAITFNASSGGLQPATITLTGGVSTNSFGPPVLFDGGTVNNANQTGGNTLAPGTVAAVYGQNLASSTVSPGVVPLVSSFNGTQVIVSGVAAPLFFLSNGQLNIQIPAELAANQSHAVAVAVNNAFAVLPSNITLAPAVPGVVGFSDGRIIAQHADFTLVDASNPAKPGETIVLYLSGMGATSPAVESGKPAPSTAPFATLTNAPTVTVDGQPASFVYAGLTPGGIGLYQINLTIPAGARTGDLEVVVKQNGIVSNSTKVPVRP